MTDPLTELRIVVLEHVPHGPKRERALEAVDAAAACLVDAHQEIANLNRAIAFHTRAARGLVEKLKRGGIR